MPKGRKTIPSKVIELRGGTARTHRPPRDAEPKPPEKMPRCPKHLNKEARKEWRRAGKILQAIGLLTEIDMMIFAAYCESYAQWGIAVQNEQMLAKIIMTPEIDLSGHDQLLIEYQSEHKRWKDANEQIESTGLVYKKMDGTPGTNPYLKIGYASRKVMASIRKAIAMKADKAHEQMIKAGTQIGVSPSSRATLKVEKPKPRSKADEFMGRKNGVKGE